MALSWKWFERYVLDSKWRNDPVPVLLVLWGLFIFYGTLLPFEFSASGEQITQKLKGVWERPLERAHGPMCTRTCSFFFPGDFCSPCGWHGGGPASSSAWRSPCVPAHS